jgi:branched-chain amino acid transport system permease protein
MSRAGPREPKGAAPTGLRSDEGATREGGASRAPGGERGKQGAQLAFVVALLAFAVAFPVLFPNPVVTNYGVYALIFVAVASAWNIFSGFSGYISLGHAVFFGSGAYTLGIAARDWHVTGTAVFALMPLSAVTGALIAVPFGLIALRVRRHTFIVITIAVFFIFQLMAYNFSFTGGTTGLDAPFLPWAPQTYNNPFYYIALACSVVAIAAAWLIRRSRFGLQLRAIRDDEDRARGLGVRAMRVKLSALVLSGAITGLVGALWFFYLGQVAPSSGFDPLFDLSVVLMAFLGGLGTVSGPVLGALIVEPGQLYLTANTNGYISEILLGSLFLVAVLLVPRGIIPTGGEYIRRLTTRGRAAIPEGGPASQRAPAPTGLRSDEGATREGGASRGARRRVGKAL